MKALRARVAQLLRDFGVGPYFDAADEIIRIVHEATLAESAKVRPTEQIAENANCSATDDYNAGSPSPDPVRENLTEGEFRQCLPDNGAFADWECIPACIECGADANESELFCDDCEFLARRKERGK